MAILGARPDTRQISPHLIVQDGARAVGAGATAALPPTDTFFGDRYGRVTDPFGHIWSLATVKEVLTPEQVAERPRASSSQTS